MNIFNKETAENYRWIAGAGFISILILVLTGTLMIFLTLRQSEILNELAGETLVEFDMTNPTIYKGEVCPTEGDNKISYQLTVSWLKEGIAESVEDIQTSSFLPISDIGNPPPKQIPVRIIGQRVTDRITDTIWAKNLTDGDYWFISCTKNKGKDASCYDIPFTVQCD